MKTFACRLDGAYQVHGARNAERLAQRQEQVLTAKRRKPFKTERRLVAYINCGRWLVDCLCGAGNAVDTETATALCFGCGAVHETIVLPDEAEQIEQVLLLRRVEYRHWFPGETAATLAAENAAHGVN